MICAIMNTQLTEIAFILDRSGSMQSQAGAAISGFNDFLRQQKDTPGETRFTLVLFNSQYEVPANAIPLAEVVDLDSSTYEPRGNTALLDAIGRTIDDIGARLAATAEPARPGQVIIAILTDGLENASRQYNLAQVSERIAHQREIYKWQFFFLGANQDAIATAAAMRIDRDSASNFAADDQGILGSSLAMSRKISAVRKMSVGAAMSMQEEADLHASLSKLQKEEDRKQREK